MTPLASARPHCSAQHSDRPPARMRTLHRTQPRAAKGSPAPLPPSHSETQRCLTNSEQLSPVLAAAVPPAAALLLLLALPLRVAVALFEFLTLGILGGIGRGGGLRRGVCAVGVPRILAVVGAVRILGIRAAVIILRRLLLPLGLPLLLLLALGALGVLLVLDAGADDLLRVGPERRRHLLVAVLLRNVVTDRLDRQREVAPHPALGRFGILLALRTARGGRSRRHVAQRFAQLWQRIENPPRGEIGGAGVEMRA